MVKDGNVSPKQHKSFGQGGQMSIPRASKDERSGSGSQGVLELATW